jgi:short chain dehydrogenase
MARGQLTHCGAQGTTGSRRQVLAKSPPFTVARQLRMPRFANTDPDAGQAVPPPPMSLRLMSFNTAHSEIRTLDMALLTAKIAVITGGASGIGLATASCFLDEGAHVFIFGRRRAEIDAALGQLGENATGVAGDVTNARDLDRLYAAVAEAGRGLDVIFANAGVGGAAQLGAITSEHFDLLFDINVKGVVFTVQKLLPLLNDGASIILNASVAADRGREGDGGYNQI